jgi:hypothetical protein
LEEIDIGDGKTPRPTFVNKTLETDPRDEMIGLLKEYSDCFAWNYTKMPGLSREIVEHRLPIKSGFRPFKQKAITFRPDLLPRIKDEIRRLCWGLVLKFYELRTRQPKMLMVKVLRTSKHYLPQDIMIFRRRL